MNAFVNHSAARRISATILLVFIENRTDRAEHLRSLVKKWKPKFPDNMNALVVDKKFDPTMRELLDDLKQARKRLAPAFVMIDPFGVKDFSMKVIQGILSNPSCEAYITIMWSRMSRFSSKTEFRPYMDDIFGSEWKSITNITSDDGRKELYRIYKQRLKNAGARYVLIFDLYKGNRIEYSIFFATQKLTGCDKMKQAIWKVSPFGDFSFRGQMANQPILFSLEPDYDPLRTTLLNLFSGDEWIRIEDVLDFVKSDETIYHSRQLKSVLRSMEDEGLLQVQSDSRKNQRTYPDGCLIRFSDIGQRRLL